MELVHLGSEMNVSSVHDTSSFGILFRDLTPSKKTKSVRHIMESAPVYRLGEIAKVVSQSIGTTSMRYGDLSDDEDEIDSFGHNFEVTLPVKMIRDLLFWDKRDAVLYSCAGVFVVFVLTSTSSKYVANVFVLEYSSCI